MDRLAVIKWPEFEELNRRYNREKHELGLSKYLLLESLSDYYSNCVQVTDQGIVIGDSASIGNFIHGTEDMGIFIPDILTDKTFEALVETKIETCKSVHNKLQLILKQDFAAIYRGKQLGGVTIELNSVIVSVYRMENGKYQIDKGVQPNKATYIVEEDELCKRLIS